tara:strand:- start:265 stop:795 length:531 start_codon:yes stop_codon:yes gene_type:complete
MKLAQKFAIPIVTFIDTPGAYPGIGAEERGQSEAIASCLYLMSSLKTPIISIVTGEGGSGGALAIGAGDRLIMLQYSIYAVISPEGCASILWGKSDKAEKAAEAMNIISEKLRKDGLVDEVIEEPVGGAHRDPEKMADTIREAIIRNLSELEMLKPDDLLIARSKRTSNFGKYRNI